MTTEELAKLMDGGAYRSVPTAEHDQLAAEHGLLIVYGASDDLCEFRGAFEDEVDCYNGECVFIDEFGIVPDWSTVWEEGCRDEIETWFRRDKQKKDIIAVWGDGDYSWTYKTDLPHATFDILDNGEPYCRGMVIDAADLE